MGELDHRQHGALGVLQIGEPAHVLDVHSGKQALAPKLTVDYLTGAVQVTLGVVYVTLYFRLPITQRFPVRRPPATS